MDHRTGTDEAITALDHISDTLVDLWRETREQAVPGVSEQQMRVLQALEPADTHLSELAGRLALPPSSATRLCDRLARHDLLVRRPLGRHVIICLTPTGHRLLAAIREVRRERLEQAWQQIPSAEQATLAPVLVRLHHQSSRDRNRSGGAPSLGGPVAPSRQRL